MNINNVFVMLLFSYHSTTLPVYFDIYSSWGKIITNRIGSDMEEEDFIIPIKTPTNLYKIGIILEILNLNYFKFALKLNYHIKPRVGQTEWGLLITLTISQNIRKL